MTANLPSVPSNIEPSGQSPVSYPIALPTQQTEVQSKVHSASDAIPNSAEAAKEAILGKVSNLSEKAHQIGKCYTTAVKVMDFLATYGVNLLLATGAIAGGIVGAVLLNVPAGVAAITFGVAELVHIYRMQPVGNPKVDALLNKFKDDINGIQELNEANKKVTTEIGEHIQKTHNQLESLLQGLEDIETLETHNNEDLTNLKNDILNLINLAESDKDQAFRLFEDCKNKSQEAEKGFESCEKLIAELALLDTTTLSNEESVNKLTTNIAKLNGDFGKSFTLYRKSQKKLTKGLMAFTAASSKNEEIKGKIKLLKSDSKNILNLLQAEKEKIKAVQIEVEKVEKLVEVVEEQQGQIDHLTEELGNTSEKIGEETGKALKEGAQNAAIVAAFGAWLGNKAGIGAAAGAALGAATPYFFQNVTHLTTPAVTHLTTQAITHLTTQAIVKTAETIIALEGSSSSTEEEGQETSDEANGDKSVSSSASREEEIDEPVSSLTGDESDVEEIVGNEREANDVQITTQEKPQVKWTPELKKFFLATALTNKLFIERAVNMIAKEKEQKETEAAEIERVEGPNFM